MGDNLVQAGPVQNLYTLTTRPADGGVRTASAQADAAAIGDGGNMHDRAFPADGRRRRPGQENCINQRRFAGDVDGIRAALANKFS